MASKEPVTVEAVTEGAAYERTPVSFQDLLGMDTVALSSNSMDMNTVTLYSDLLNMDTQVNSKYSYNTK